MRLEEWKEFTKNYTIKHKNKLPGELEELQRACQILADQDGENGTGDFMGLYDAIVWLNKQTITFSRQNAFLKKSTRRTSFWTWHILQRANVKKR